MKKIVFFAAVIFCLQPSSLFADSFPHILYEDCNQCGGRGIIKRGYDYSTCKQCDGDGEFIPGQHITELIVLILIVGSIAKSL